MRTRKIAILVVCLMACAALVVTWTASRPGVGTLTLAIVDQGTDDTGLHSVLLLVTNAGPYRICYPDGFFVRTKGAARETYVPTTNLWLDPGAGATIVAGLPSIATDWYGAVSYYEESPWNRIRMRLAASSIGPRLPSAFVTVQGAEVRGPWMIK